MCICSKVFIYIIIDYCAYHCIPVYTAFRSGSFFYKLVSNLIFISFSKFSIKTDTYFRFVNLTIRLQLMLIDANHIISQGPFPLDEGGAKKDIKIFIVANTADASLDALFSMMKVVRFL